MNRITLAISVAVVAVGVTTFGALAAGGQPGVPTEDSASGTDAVAGACQVGKLSYISSLAQFTTTAAAMADLPDSTVQFKLGGKAPSCVKIDFTAETFTADQGEALVVRAMLDDSTLGSPDDVIMDGDADEDGDGMWVRAHSTSFIFTSVAPGTHTAKIQFRGTFGKTVTVRHPSVYVQHR